MIKERADELVSALRSGEFQQGKTMLNRSNDKFCCLGVACELMHRKGLLEKTKSDFHKDLEIDAYLYGGDCYLLPDAAMEYYGFKYSDGAFIDSNNNHNSLVILNANGYSFDYIADTIEKNWKQL